MPGRPLRPARPRTQHLVLLTATPPGRGAGLSSRHLAGTLRVSRRTVGWSSFVNWTTSLIESRSATSRSTPIAAATSAAATWLG